MSALPVFLAHSPDIRHRQTWCGARAPAPTEKGRRQPLGAGATTAARGAVDQLRRAERRERERERAGGGRREPAEGGRRRRERVTLSHVRRRVPRPRAAPLRGAACRRRRRRTPFAPDLLDGRADPRWGGPASARSEVLRRRRGGHSEVGEEASSPSRTGALLLRRPLVAAPCRRLPAVAPCAPLAVTGVEEVRQRRRDRGVAAPRQHRRHRLEPETLTHKERERGGGAPPAVGPRRRRGRPGRSPTEEKQGHDGVVEGGSPGGGERMGGREGVGVKKYSDTWVPRLVVGAENEI
ncbi:hypothetical protein C2845_PM09G13920 [Panicum miliaceum]|uniref:Uncharacterized protein n=1 Tax=Panicum miliaceum TaxID=4540 RepID=A0A3L6S2I4_PANMI|nr:hypothetical protein C2845_PM09G13920 [Panicum miliaceum]